MKKLLRLVATVLIVAMLLTGCSMDLESLWEEVYTMIMLGTTTHFEDMTYTRPDLTAFQEEWDACMELATTTEDVDELMDQVYLVYEGYYDFYTNYNLSNIHYSIDMTDTYWSDEYNFCTEKSADVDGWMDQLLYALADSPLREELEADDFFGEGFFDAYEGDSLWDETFTALMNEESELLNEYYDINSQAAAVDPYSEAYYTTYGVQLEEIFVELVAVRQKIAAYAGYDNYPQFAYEFNYYRDYTPEQTATYLGQIQQELVPLYREMDSSAWNAAYESCTEAQMYDYVKACAAALGGVAEDAFTLMEKAGLYDITASANKYDASFEVFLPSYFAPFVFVNPYGAAIDKLTFVHEFGHFCNDYASGGSVAGVDVAEIFSQGLEYLSLEYCENTEGLTEYKLADSLCVFVEQAAYAAFEHQVYDLTGEELTAENVRALYAKALEDYGLGDYGVDSRSYVQVPHFFIVPMYVISYVVSNDAAMQIYQLELAEKGAGVAVWEESLTSMEGNFLAFLKEAGLEDPFAEGRVAKIRETFEEVLK